MPIFNPQSWGMPLLTLPDTPLWTDPNPFIWTGYRPESRSWTRCFASWFYSHNETGNIYSHLLPAVFLAATLLLSVSAGTRFDTHTLDGSVVGFQLGSALLCLFLSTMYHTLLNHSSSVSRRCLQLDYVGILGLILGNLASGLHFGFYCAPTLRNVYWSMIACGCATTAVILLSPWFCDEEWRSLRLFSCIAIGLSAVAPISHAGYLWGYDYLLGIGVPYYLLEGVLLLVGCFVFRTRIPESFFPGQFDIWGHSHTLWHIFVVLSIVAHIAGLSHAVNYIHQSALCRG
ncbi:hemolysin-III related protein [Penicillium argentinense]|uniref:Hemolysin-III related protein n=1 Tax=Penicillium argentinense TaxID=1131581 RepID=A0A9W9G1G7_9EURO|nr:hemolysin-III related protein [Penicillium argentinense]KAJ5110238.1 hemolysin-III related protein [Penicillium argentinense]